MLVSKQPGDVMETNSEPGRQEGWDREEAKEVEFGGSRGILGCALLGRLKLPP